MRRATAVSLSALAMAGCRFELTEVEVEEPSRASLLEVATGAAFDGTLILAASFHPGRTADGVARITVDDSVRVNGEGIAADEVRSDGTRLYRINWSAAELPGGLQLRGPSVLGDADPPPELGFAPISFRVPDTLVVDREGVISIPVEGVGSGGPLWGIESPDLVPIESPSSTWSLTVRTDSSVIPLFRLEGRSPPPALIIVDAEQIPADIGDARVHLQANVRQAFSTEAGGYDVEITRTANTTIPIRLMPP